MIPYRPDIDGLRALAVLPVLFFHVGIAGFGGGYVGVDVFFVISGYLITSIIAHDLRAGTFSIAGFYDRRIRRIFPALFAVLAATLLGGLWLYMPGDLVGLAESARAAALFVSNVYFWLTDGYFTAAAQSKTLLHTWSLAVEEQFYILFPLLLWALYRWARRHTVAAVLGVLCLSLLVSMAATHLATPGGFAAQAAFYLLPTRACELLLGALLALRPVHIAAPRLGACIGLLLILIPVVTYTKTTPFPGIYAMLPCLGAALLIATGSATTPVARLLSTAPMVYIGKISYSLYLWHCPLIIFTVYAQGHRLTDVQKPLLIAVSFVAAALTWKYIEQPFRNRAPKGIRLTRTRVFAGAALAIAFITAFCSWIIGTHGLPQRWPAEVQRLAAYAQYDTAPVFRSGQCFLENADDTLANFDMATCLKTDNRPALLLVGDSHAAHIWHGLHSAFPEVNIMQATASGCRPLIGFSVLKSKQRCAEVMDLVFNDFLQNRYVDAIILAARWLPEDAESLRATVAHLKTKARHIYIVGPTAEYSMPLPSLLARAAAHNNPAVVTRALRHHIATEDATLRTALHGSGAIYLSAYRALCGARGCATVDGAGTPLQFDYGHLTAAGSLHVAKAWKAEHLIDLPTR